MWFGTSGGVSTFDGTTWTTYITDDGLAHNWVYAIAIDDAGHKWFGTWGGVSRFDGTWRTYTTDDGLANNEVWAITIDDAGHKWFGTSGGVSRFDGTTWTTHTTDDGLANNSVYAIAVNHAGHKWFGTSGGVSEFIPPDEKMWYYRHRRGEGRHCPRRSRPGWGPQHTVNTMRGARGDVIFRVETGIVSGRHDTIRDPLNSRIVLQGEPS